MIWKIYEKLIADPLISHHATGRIKFYEYPATGDFSRLYIIIDPLDVPKPSDFADNKWLTNDYLYQIDVWSNNLAITEAVAKKIQQIMWDELNFGQTGGMDEYDEDFKIYRDARRYRGKAYVEGI